MSGSDQTGVLAVLGQQHLGGLHGGAVRVDQPLELGQLVGALGRESLVADAAADNDGHGVLAVAERQVVAADRQVVEDALPLESVHVPPVDAEALLQVGATDECFEVAETTAAALQVAHAVDDHVAQLGRSAVRPAVLLNGHAGDTDARAPADVVQRLVVGGELAERLGLAVVQDRHGREIPAEHVLQRPAEVLAAPVDQVARTGDDTVLEAAGHAGTGTHQVEVDTIELAALEVQLADLLSDPVHGAEVVVRPGVDLDLADQVEAAVDRADAGRARADIQDEDSVHVDHPFQGYPLQLTVS